MEKGWNAVRLCPHAPYFRGGGITTGGIGQDLAGGICS